MRIIKLSLTGFIITALIIVSSIAHAIPNLISYQGVLNDGGGSPVSTTVSMTFSIYDVSTGGVALWNETQSVPVSNGLFNVQLGSEQQLPLSVFMQDTLYLGIQVGADPEMTPRQRIASGSYTYKASHADTAATVQQVLVPVGSIIAWAKSMTGVPALPSGWVECNGQTLSDPESSINGQIIPDLNGISGTQRFLRGSTASGTTGGSENHQHSIWRGGWSSSPASAGDILTGAQNSTTTHWRDFNTQDAPTLPSYYEIVWIMKTK